MPEVDASSGKSSPNSCDAGTQAVFDDVTGDFLDVGANDDEDRPRMAEVETQTEYTSFADAKDVEGELVDVEPAGADSVDALSADAPAADGECFIKPGVDYFETSAKTGVNIDVAVKRLTQRVLEARRAAAAAAPVNGGGGGGVSGGTSKISLTNRFILRKDGEPGVIEEWKGKTKSKCC